QKRLEPEARLHVEMVRGLVEKQEIGLAHELARERDAFLPPPRERRDRRLGRAALRRGGEPADALVRRERGLPGLVAGVRARRALEHRLADRRALAERRHLREVPDAEALLDGARALVRRDLAREDRKQRRLPGSVRADEADAVAGVHGTGDPLEQGTRAEGLRETGCGQEDSHGMKARPPGVRTELEEGRELAGPTGLEPATSGVTGLRSNQLSYDPDFVPGRAPREEAKYTETVSGRKRADPHSPRARGTDGDRGRCAREPAGFGGRCRHRTGDLLRVSRRSTAELTSRTHLTAARNKPAHTAHSPAEASWSAT